MRNIDLRQFGVCEPAPQNIHGHVSGQCFFDFQLSLAFVVDRHIRGVFKAFFSGMQVLFLRMSLPPKLRRAVAAIR